MATNTAILGQQALTLPVGGTADRPGSPQFGWIRANSDTKYIEYYDATNAVWLGIGAFNATFTNNTATQSGNYTYQTWTQSGTMSVTAGTKTID